MNSYGDPSSARGRAVPEPPAGHGAEADWPGNDGYPAADGRTGRAAVPAGRARASVPSGRASAPVGRAAASVGAAPAGRASVGRAAAPPDSGPDPTYAPSYGGARGAAGRATVGRASVRPISPAVGGPPGPGGPGGRGSGRRGGPPSPAAAAKARRRKRINWIIASFAVLIMLAGGGVVGVTYYTTTVTLPKDIGNDLALSSTLLYAGGRKEIARVGSLNRVYAKIDQIPKWVQYAVASAEDRKFYEHEGIDYVGIMRAAWNNFTGGDQQGASTITQQYARNAMNLTDVTYARKAKEAVLASKLNDQFDKPDIMEFYLNTIYFGRGAYSIESAAQAYFGKSVNKVTVEEGAVLAAVIKQPVPSATHPGFDPQLNEQGAKDRWNYVLDGMAEKGWFPPEFDRAAAQYPKVRPWDDKTSSDIEVGLNTPAGNVINYVTQEFSQMTDPKTGGPLCQPGACLETIRNGGFRITTSLNPSMQKAAEEVASRRKGSEMDGQAGNLMAALVSVDPKNGRVLAYYGGEKHTGTDYAGKNWEGGKVTGGHPPGSSFKIYTLAAALQGGVSLKSHWDGRPIKTGPYAGIRNAAEGGAADCGGWCPLDHSTVKSLNVPFFHVTQHIGVSKVLATAKAAGITTMWDTIPGKGEAHDIGTLKSEEQARQLFDYHVGFGQYPVTVLEHANGVATLAARGIYNKAHFVVKVERKNRETGKFEPIAGEQLAPKQAIPKAVADDVASVLQKIPPSNGDGLKEGRDAAGKTGSWQLRDTARNAHAWMIGYTPQLATAVWIGNKTGEKAIKLKGGGDIYGATLPADVWKRFMNRALNGRDKAEFPPAANVGDDTVGNGESPEPKEPPRDQDPNCTIPIFCPDDGNGGGNNDGGNDDDNGNGRNRGPGGNDPPDPPPGPNAPRRE